MTPEIGIIYIMTNVEMPNVIKIGRTDNLERRMKEMFTTSIPVKFECYFAVRVNDPAKIERKIHQGLDSDRVSPNREYFYTSKEQAKSLLEIAVVMGGEEVTPTSNETDLNEDQVLENAKKRRARFNFEMLDISPGTELTFKKDSSIKCSVVNATQVEFRGTTMSLSASAELVLAELGYDWAAVQGPIWWCIDSRSLDEIRRQEFS